MNNKIIEYKLKQMTHYGYVKSLSYRNKSHQIEFILLLLLLLYYLLLYI
jgi:hypothetical protein